MTINVHRPDTPQQAPPPALGTNFGYLHGASGGQLGCLIGLLSIFGLFVIGMFAGDSLRSSDSGLLGWFVIGVSTLLVLGARRADRRNISAKGPVFLSVVSSDYDDERIIERMIGDASRFTRMVEDAGLTAVSQNEIQHVGWVVWHAGVRTNRIGELRGHISAAGERVTGPAKAAWLSQRREEIGALREPIVRAAEELSRLADLAEDVVFAAALAKEAGVRPGELYGTLGLELPQPFDVASSDAIEEATRLLGLWHTTWMELDDQLRAAAELRP